MPECRHCARILPRAELRKTTLGFVCLERGETGKFSRCFKLSKERAAAARATLREARREQKQAAA